jgi:hypothetical protein
LARREGRKQRDGKVGLMDGGTFLEQLDEEPEALFHGSSESNLANFLAAGVKSPSYWSRSYEMAVYYAVEAAEADGGDTLVLRVGLDRFTAAELEPDRAAAAEPICTILGPEEEEIVTAWEQSEGNWHDSLALLDSVIYQGADLVISEGEIYEIESVASSELELKRLGIERNKWAKARAARGVA